MLRSKLPLIVIVAVAVALAVLVPVTALMKGVGNDPSDAAIGDKKPQIRSEAEVVKLLGPVSENRNLKDIPKRNLKAREDEEVPLMRHPLKQTRSRAASDPMQTESGVAEPATMPTPTSTFAGITSAQSGCGCLPPDTDGDVGPNDYIESVNSSIKILDKAGNQLQAPTNYNTFFSALGTSVPCGNNLNDGDGIVFFDHVSDRWVVSDFAFGAFPGTAFYQCIGVSKTDDPVAGGWWLYAVQVDPNNTNFLGDYPKFGIWSNGYYMAVNLFSNNTTFNGVRVYSFDRNAMINGLPATVQAFNISPATLGDAYSLVPASYRTGSPPPAGTDEYFMAINSSSTAGTVENQVFTWRFHVDFANPANTTFGVGPTNTPNGVITVNGFVDAETSTSTLIVPENGTTRTLDTLGDKLMYPLIYQNRGGTESIYSTHTVNNNQNGTGPTEIRWYQFDVTGGTIPATPVQQQTFDNGGDGVWRWMPSINVDSQGNVAIGYAASGPFVAGAAPTPTPLDPSIRYAGRLVGDPASTLAQGEVVMQAGGGHQTSSSGRWGDYTALFVDPSDGCSFWHVGEYFSATSSASWNTRIGNFKYPTCAIAAGTGSVSGRIMGGGQGVAGAIVTITDGLGGTRTAVSSAFGYYDFDNVNLGGQYTVSVSAKRYHYTPQTITVGQTISGLDFFGT